MIDDFVLNFIKSPENIKNIGFDDREIMALHLRFGFLDGKKHSYRSIGEKLKNNHGRYKYSEKEKIGVCANRAHGIVMKCIKRINKMR